MSWTELVLVSVGLSGLPLSAQFFEGRLESYAQISNLLNQQQPEFGGFRKN